MIQNDNENNGNQSGQASTNRQLALSLQVRWRILELQEARAWAERRPRGHRSPTFSCGHRSSGMNGRMVGSLFKVLEDQEQN